MRMHWQTQGGTLHHTRRLFILLKERKGLLTADFPAYARFYLGELSVVGTHDESRAITAFPFELCSPCRFVLCCSWQGYMLAANTMQNTQTNSPETSARFSWPAG